MTSDPLDCRFHAAALEAFLTVSVEQQDWPDSEAVRKRAYALYETELKEKNDKSDDQLTEKGTTL